MCVARATAYICHRLFRTPVGPHVWTSLPGASLLSSWACPSLFAFFSQTYLTRVQGTGQLASSSPPGRGDSRPSPLPRKDAQRWGLEGGRGLPFSKRPKLGTKAKAGTKAEPCPKWSNSDHLGCTYKRFPGELALDQEVLSTAVRPYPAQTHSCQRPAVLGI